MRITAAPVGQTTHNTLTKPDCTILGSDLVNACGPVPALTYDERVFECSKSGNQYSRRDVFDVLAVPQEARRGDWFTGYHKHQNEWFIFAGVGVPGRTGHDYQNEWQGNQLLWRGKTQSNVGQPVIAELIGGNHGVKVFWRTDDRAPFTYAGLARVADVKETVPVTILWSLTLLARSPMRACLKRCQFYYIRGGRHNISHG